MKITVTLTKDEIIKIIGNHLTLTHGVLLHGDIHIYLCDHVDLTKGEQTPSTDLDRIVFEVKPIDKSGR